MKGRTWFVAGILAGWASLFAVERCGKGLTVLPCEPARAAEDPLASLLDELRAVTPGPKGVRVYPATVVDRSRPLLPEIGRVLDREGDSGTTRLLLELVAQMGPGARSVLPEVIRSLAHGADADAASSAMRSICSDREMVLKGLASFATGPSARAKEAAILAIQDFGGPQDALFTVLRPFLADPDADVRAAAAGVIHGVLLAGDRAFEPLEEGIARNAILDDDAAGGGGALLSHGIRSGQCIDVLVGALKKEGAVTDDRLESLVFFSSFSSKGVSDRILKMQSDANPRIRKWGVLLDFHGIQATRRGILPRLRKALEDPDESVKREARLALDRLEGKE